MTTARAEIEPQQARPLGRPCATCAHPRRAEIESAMLSGDVLISALSNEFHVSISGLRRHRTHHMIASAEAIRTAGLEPVEIITRLAEIAERLGEAAEAAEQRGRIVDMVRASDGQRRALEALAGLGVRHESIAADLDFGAAIAGALGRLARRTPEIAEAVAAELDAADRPAIAADLRGQIRETRGALNS